MNKVYYKGYLATIKNEYDFKFYYEDTKKANFSYKEMRILEKIIEDYWLQSKIKIEKIENEDICKKLNEEIYIDGTLSKNEIIFEIIENEEGFNFAKEIYTNKIFPLVDRGDIKREFYLTKSTKNGSGQGLFYYDYVIKVISNINNPFILKADNLLYLPKCNVATSNEINEYLKQFVKKSIFGKEKENEKKLKIIIKLSNDNVFKSEIIEKKEEKIIREKQSDITSTMEKIEYLLIKLDKINHNLKLEKQKKYEELINSNNDNERLTTTPFTISTLKSLEAEIEYSIEFNSKNGNDILETLDNMINEYESNDITNRTIKDIDKLITLFLQMKDNYSYSIQRQTIDKFALLYIYEIYENKDSIRLEDLSDSYINDYLRSILICLNTLIDNNKIENNIIIKLDDNITLDYIIDCIKEIKFIKNKELIKEK